MFVPMSGVARLLCTLEDKGFAVINGRGRDDPWSTGQANCIWDRVSQGHVEMEGQVKVTPASEPDRHEMSVMKTRCLVSFMVPRRPWVSHWILSQPRTDTSHPIQLSSSARRSRSSSLKIKIAVSLRDEEKDWPEPFPVGSSLKKIAYRVRPIICRYT